MTSSSLRWCTVSSRRLLLVFSLGIFFLVIVARTDGFVPILDHVNLAFHEAGHLIYGIFGSTVGLYGGTLGQLTFPGVVVVLFWRRTDLMGFYSGLLWIFQNFINIARYMADARAQELPLVGGGLHDWTEIFSRWDILPANLTIASWTRAIGWSGLMAVTAWIGWIWWDSLSREKEN